MLNYQPPEMPILERDLEIRYGGYKWYRFFVFGGMGLVGIALLSVLIMALFTGILEGLIALTFFSIILGIVSIVIGLTRGSAHTTTVRLKALKLLCEEGTWQPYQPFGKRIEVNETAMGAGAIASVALGGVAGGKVGSALRDQISARGEYYAGVFPFDLNIRAMVKCRATSGDQRAKVMAFSPDPKADTERDYFWVLTHPDTQYGVAETAFVDCQLYG